MSQQASSAASAGIGLPGCLLVLFVALKLCGVISWSWWWVLSPLWLSLAGVIGVLVVLAIVMWRRK